MAETFFTKVANDVLEASEQLATRMEEGISAVMTGELPKETSGGAPSDVAAETGEFGPGLEEEMVLSEEDLEVLNDEDPEFSPLHRIADSVVGDIMGDQVGPQTAMEQFEAFRHAITWSEPLILYLVAFQVTMTLLTMIVSRRGCSVIPRVMLMIFIAGVVRSAERLNRYGSRHWERFATQNYFDERGVFVSIMLCGPLLLDSFIMLLLFLREASQLLVQVKTAELKKKKLEKSRKSANGTSRRTKKDQ